MPGVTKVGIHIDEIVFGIRMNNMPTDIMVINPPVLGFFQPMINPVNVPRGKQMIAMSSLGVMLDIVIGSATCAITKTRMKLILNKLQIRAIHKSFFIIIGFQ